MSPSMSPSGSPSKNPEVLRYAAFTDAGMGGNPAGVVLDAGSLTDEEMLAIARTLGYSESAFLQGRSEEENAWRLRFFSPVAEVPFCGHATLATAVSLAERDGPGQVSLSTPAGLVEVRTAATAEGLTATLTSVPTHTRPVEPDALERALAALGWGYDDLDPHYPVHVGFGGNEHLLVAARSIERLAAFDYDYDALARLMAEEGWTTVHAFWADDLCTEPGSEGPGSDGPGSGGPASDGPASCGRCADGAVFHARDAFPPGGVVEDPATGAAAAAFGGYLRDLGLVEVPSRVTVLQGRHMGRPSRLLVDLDATSGSVRVTGTATRIAAPA
jgi:PhzF family phenazine biosynthesis protein